MYSDILLSLFIHLKMFVHQQLLLKFPKDEQMSSREEEPSLTTILNWVFNQIDDVSTSSLASGSVWGSEGAFCF